MRFLAPAAALLMLAACGGSDRRSNVPGGSEGSGGASDGVPGAAGGEDRGKGGDAGAPGDGSGDDQGQPGDGPADELEGDPEENQDPDPSPPPEPDPEPDPIPDAEPDPEPEPEPERTACGWLKADHGNLEATGRSEGDVISNVRYVDQCGEDMEMYDFNGEYYILYMTAAW